MRSMMASVATAALLACGVSNDQTDTSDTASSDSSLAGEMDCSDGVCILSGTFVDDLTMTTDNVYLLRGGVFIGDDKATTVLTIEPGVSIYGETSTDGMLSIRRNSRIEAVGTREAPILMTSSKRPGSRARGDWGGLIINGKAPVNSCGSDFAGGVCEAFGEGGTGFYGGNDPEDNSGTLKYVRIEFAGTLLSPDNELNGIAFQGVGSGTTIDYIQVHMNADDGVEFYGGTATMKHAVISGVGDDMLDWTDGWQGKAQFLVLQQHDDSGDNGFEGDNNGENNVVTPMSMPTISNVTIIGSPESDASDIGMLIREGTGGDFSNIVVTGFNDACLDIDNDATFANADSGDLVITNTLLDCTSPFESDDDDAAAVSGWFLNQAGNTIGSANLADPYNQTSPIYAPRAEIGGGASPADSFFDSVSFIGAIGSDDWTTGWTSYPAN
jgi:hypothetical protein